MLNGRKAVVTGGSRGIGRAIVERLVADGAEVIFSYRSRDEAADEVLDVCNGQARAIRQDLAEPDGATRLMQQAHDQLGGLDILINNAASSFAPAPLAELDVSIYDETMAVGARAAYLTLQFAARSMSDDGRIVNISTLNTVRPAPGIAPYAASKGALEQLTAIAAHELGPRGITVNTVSPGATDTELLRSSNPEEALAMIAQMTPLGRLGRPDDVADVVAMLVGPDAHWITGQNLRATGGI
ncbi:MAG TPA: SDR family oxidoreductase [Microlunatus sp.]